MKIVIIDYNAGNIRSVENACRRLDVEPVITADPQLIREADKVIFPGVGDAGTAMPYLRERHLDEVLVSLKQPFLGICFGMQLMCKHSEEGDVDCLGIFDVNVKRFPSGIEKVPHMGWNTITDLKGTLLKNISPESYVYFVHSYYAEMNPFSTATCNYVLPFSAGIEKDNFFAFQFHPEKSGIVGAQILQNFIEL